MSLDVVRNSHQKSQHAQTLDGHLLPHVVLGAGGPGEEGADVLGELREGGGGTIVILNNLIVERSGLDREILVKIKSIARYYHADSSAREVRVEVLSLPQFDACRWVAVAVEKMVDVILITVPRQR